MKKTIFFLVLNVTACEYYTIQNDYIEDVRAGYVIINSGQCSEFFDFPFLGDFPLKFRYKDHQLMSNKLYPPNHYKISKEGDILKQKTACELDPVRKKDNSAEAHEKTDQTETDNDANTKGDSSQTGENGLKKSLETDNDANTKGDSSQTGEDGLKKSLETDNDANTKGDSGQTGEDGLKTDNSVTTDDIN